MCGVQVRGFLDDLGVWGGQFKVVEGEAFRVEDAQDLGF